jgi:hypothetical protein
MRGTRADPTRIATIRACVADGRGVSEAARLLGMQKQHAWRLAKSLGLTRRVIEHAANVREFWTRRDPSVRSTA